MSNKTQGLFLGEPEFLWRRYLPLLLTLPCFLLMWEILIEPLIPAATDVDLAPVTYLFYQAVSALLWIGTLVDLLAQQ